MKTQRQLAEDILDDLERTTWAVYREDKINIILHHLKPFTAEAAIGREYDEERREIARRAAGGQ